MLRLAAALADTNWTAYLALLDAAPYMLAAAAQVHDEGAGRGALGDLHRGRAAGGSTRR